ncbi:hypothetical protein [Heliophilum fasciatum]|uniref:Uncharacterized protein n=1 Tax=Heliophilum fasciatum TaxID=35700 RepID=A0A4R2RNN7_9FIRM|nr:hypothetical protein [Heliophilum fasciatum]MCW2279218.1 hypothetical protein [Heliophilum fasciatum]TCP60805.1 hypothetical protein EDD73_1338 [Heliophilum fasciatum]
MDALDAQGKRYLLTLLSKISPAGISELETDTAILQTILPLPDHRRALEPDILLILGGRGSGKTKFFRLLGMAQGRQALIKKLGSRALADFNQTHWVNSLGRTKQKENRFPLQDSVSQFGAKATALDWRAFWVGLLLGSVLHYVKQDEGKSFSGVLCLDQLNEPLRLRLENHLNEIASWVPLVRDQFEGISALLDEVDERLLQSDQWLFITYDEIDRLTPGFTELVEPICGLLAFWLDRWRRWERIRPKIFLRTDLFSDEFLQFPDAAKLKAHQIRLEWTTPWLYQLLVRSMANVGMEEYLQSIPGLLSTKDPVLGWLPGTDEKLFQQLTEQMIGEYMGANPRRGSTFRWIPHHLQDADGRITPRSFLKLFALAAQREKESFNADQLPEARLLQPLSLQGALIEASKVRIQELCEGYPWLAAITPTLHGLEVPVEKKFLLQAIQDTKWEGEKNPPNHQPESILRYLIQLGIAEERLDTRINVPEIYLYGFGLKRRGGIKRPK